MKKLVCFFAVLIMLLGISAYAENSAELYESLGIILPDDTNDPLTRGDFARTAVTLIPDADRWSGDIPFYDVSEDSKYYSAVSCLYGKAVIKGTGQNLYSPEKNITSAETCAIIIRILGYDFMADGKYQAAAMNLGLLKGVTFNGDGTVSKSMARRMIFNALETEIGTYEYVNGALRVDLQDSATYLERCFGVYKINGVVSDNGKTSLYGASSAGKGNTVIGEHTYKNESSSDYLACEVEAWYVTENDTDIIKYMSPRYDNAVLEFNARDIKSFADGQYKIEKEPNKTKTYRLSDTYKIIYNESLYNGEYTKENLENILIPEIGTVKLTDSNGDGKYDTVIVKSYETFVVSGTVESSKTIVDKLDSTRKISFENVDELDVMSIDGSRRDFGNILSGEVISVAMNDDKSYAEIIISENKITGQNVSVSSEYITIDEAEHYMTKSYRKYLENISASRLVNAVFYTDFEGNIAYHDMNLENGTVAYLIGYYREESGDGVVMKLHTEDNEFKKLKLAEKVSIDGSVIKRGKQFDIIASKQYTDGYLINYKQNDEQEITKIDFAYYQNVPENRDAESFHIIDGYEHCKEKLKTSKIGAGLALESDTKVWIVPTEGGDDQINVVQPSATASGAYGPTLTLTAYSFEEYALSSKYVVVSDKEFAGFDMANESYASNQKPMIVKEIRKAYKNDETVNCIVVSDGGQYKELYTSYEETPVCRKSGKQLRVGDMIRYSTDKAGMIPQNGLIIMYSPSDDENGFEGMYYNNGNFDNATHDVNSNGVGIIYGWVNARNSKYMEIAFKVNPKTQKIKASDKRLYSVGAMNVTVYDKKTKKVSIGTTDDILVYKDSGVGSKIILSISYDVPNLVYVIKED